METKPNLTIKTQTSTIKTHNYLQDKVCRICDYEDGHTICPGCTGGIAQKFDAFVGCGVDLACPLCLGLDFMRRDKALQQTYSGTGCLGMRKMLEVGWRDLDIKMCAPSFVTHSHLPLIYVKITHLGIAAIILRLESRYHDRAA